MCVHVHVCVLLTFKGSSRRCRHPTPVAPDFVLPSGSTRTVLQACPEMRNKLCVICSLELSKALLAIGLQSGAASGVGCASQ